MSGPPLVSVVMAVYQGRDHLADAVRSVLDQELEDLELVVVDDGSSDGTADLLTSLAREDARLRVLSHENRGLTASLIRGCEVARGRYIARQDADDRSLPGRLAAQVELLERSPEVTLVSCSASYVGPAGEPLLTLDRAAEPERATSDFVERWQGLPAHGTAMFRRADYEAAGGYRAVFHYAQDSDLWLRLTERGLLAYVPRVLYACRYDPGSITSARRTLQRRFGRLGRQAADARREGRSEEPILREASALRERVLSGDVPPPSRRDAARGFYFVGANLSSARPRAAIPYLWNAVRRDPLLLRGWLRLGAAALAAPFWAHPETE